MQRKRFRIISAGLLVLTGASFIAMAGIESPVIPEKDNMIVHFENVEEEHIKNCFTEVLRRYDKLHDYEITLVQKELRGSTMQAQPIISLGNLFSDHKHYRIKLAKTVRDAADLPVSDIPEMVLKGWFAHELGHVIDYEDRSNFSMIGYGLRYTFSGDFKKAVEHEADSIAIQHGFHEEIIATKKFLLDNDLVSEKYKAKLRKYYMPISGVEMCVKENPPVKPDVEL